MKRFILFFLCLSWILPFYGQVQTEFDQLVQELQLDVNVTDYSDALDIKLDEPQLAYANLTGITDLPKSKNKIQKAWLEFYDGAGHYFRKQILIHGQGGYTLRHPKCNASFTFCEDDSGDITTNIRFGNWVSQDGFHLKAFYTDFSRGIGEICYKMFARIVEDRLPYWERGGYMNSSRARCFPDGFPCILYLNGQFHGIYAWQLKKSHKNMNMEKSNATHIHLDGNLSDNNLFHGFINWSQFEVRNPQNLETALGLPYDNNHPSELKAGQVKSAILRLSSYHGELETLVAMGASAEEVRARFEEYFDVESLLDYVVFFYFTANGDGSLKNWQWFTYDGTKWMVTPYDLDQCLGLGLYGQVRGSNLPVENLTTGPFYWLNLYYQDEICERWKELRQSGVLSGETLVPIAVNWCDRVGNHFYELERQRWPLSPCYCEPICNDNWQPYDQWDNYFAMPDYSSSTTYQAGDIVKLQGRLWQVTGTTCGVDPFIRNAQPDSIQRLEAWIPDRITFLDNVFGYHDETGFEQHIPNHHDDEVIAIYTLSGIRVETPSKGVYIVRYRNGSTKKVYLSR